MFMYINSIVILPSKNTIITCRAITLFVTISPQNFWLIKEQLHHNWIIKQAIFLLGGALTTIGHCVVGGIHCAPRPIRAPYSTIAHRIVTNYSLFCMRHFYCRIGVRYRGKVWRRRNCSFLLLVGVFITIVLCHSNNQICIYCCFFHSLLLRGSIPQYLILQAVVLHCWLRFEGYECW